MKVHYPIGFDDTGGVGKRVAILNSYLRTDYALLGQTIRYRHAKISSYNRAVDRDSKLFQLKQYFLDRLYSDISGWKHTQLSFFLLEKFLEETYSFQPLL